MGLLLTLLLAAADATRPTVAILPPTPEQGADTWIGMAVADNINTRLLFHSRFDPKTVTRYYPLNVMGWRQTLSAARAEGLDTSKELSTKELGVLRRQLGADYIVCGAYKTEGKKVFLAWDFAGDKPSKEQRVSFDLTDFASLTEKIATQVLTITGQSTKGIESHQMTQTPIAALKPYAEALEILSHQSLDPRAQLVLPKPEIERAIRLLSAATDADENFVRGWVAKGVAAAMIYDTEQAEASLVRAMTTAGEFDPETSLGIYYLYARQGDVDKGIKVLEDTTTTHLGFLHGLGYLGLAYERVHQNHEALRIFALYEQRVPKSPWARVRRAEALSHTGNHVQAIAETEAVVKEFPLSVMAITALASRQIDAEKYDEAKLSLERGLKLAPNHPALLTRLSYIALEQDKPEAALKLAEDAVKALGDGRGEPLAGYAHVNLGHALALIGRTDEAFAALQKAKTLGVDSEPLIMLWRDPRLKDFLMDPHNPFPPRPQS